MISYSIAMGFIAWMMAIMMWFGFLMIKLCEVDLNDENSKSDHMTKMNAELIVQEYNGKNVIGRAGLVLTLGARVFSVMVGMLRKGDK